MFHLIKIKNVFMCNISEKKRNCGIERDRSFFLIDDIDIQHGTDL